MGRRKYTDEQRERAEQRRRFKRCGQQRARRLARRALKRQPTKACLFSGNLNSADSPRDRDLAGEHESR
jgi:hypothetical protein